MTIFSDSKQLQLLARRIHRLRFAIAKNLHIAKLFVRDTQNTDVAIFRHKRFNPFDMHFSVLIAWTMSQINGKLEHCETISHDALAKSGVGLTLFLRLCRQIKKHQHPHNPVFTETVHHNSIIG